MLDAAEEPTELRVPPANWLEHLKGDHQGQHSIRRSDQWRICFRSEGGTDHEVEIVDGERTVTADTALRRSRYLGTTARFWLNLQAQFDLDDEVDRLGDRLDREVAAHAN